MCQSPGCSCSWRTEGALEDVYGNKEVAGRYMFLWLIHSLPPVFVVAERLDSVVDLLVYPLFPAEVLGQDGTVFPHAFYFL